MNREWNIVLRLKKTNVRYYDVMFPYSDVQELFVDVCLDFSIAQYMEDCFSF